VRSDVQIISPRPFLERKKAFEFLAQKPFFYAVIERKRAKPHRSLARERLVCGD
jgi:hypothetical protein